MACTQSALESNSATSGAARPAVAQSGATLAGTHPSRRAPLLGPGSGHEEGGEFAVSGLGSLGVTQYGELR